MGAGIFGLCLRAGHAVSLEKVTTIFQEEVHKCKISRKQNNSNCIYSRCKSKTVWNRREATSRLLLSESPNGNTCRCPGEER